MNHGEAVSSKISDYLTDTFTFSPFLSAFITSYLLIIVNELGDKTFFIAAILAMKRGACVTYVGSGSALILMTLISAMAGRTLPALMNPVYTHYASVALFICFGVKMLWEAYNMPDDSDQPDHPPGESNLIREIELELANKENGAHGGGAESPCGGAAMASVDLEKGAARNIESRSSTSGRVGSGCSPKFLSKSFLRRAFVSAAFTEAFTMTFAAEWGDRSQIATLALGASKNIYGVNLGAMTAHLTCTALAVFGGRILVMKLSEKTISIIGGVTFLVFASAGLYFWPGP